MPEHHARDGLSFERNQDGSVRVTARADGRADAPVARSVTLSGDEWASAVEAVSGEDEKGGGA